jgi:prepilin-type N-terminal cleavage/methylation domain-containing protein
MKKIMQKGFTLVELLIVIALLGALAIGLIGALDPFEQLKKGTDTGTRNSVSEVHSAIIRYYALKGVMPWCPTGCTIGTTYITSQVLSAATYLQGIIDTGELKANFTTVSSGDLSKIYVSGTDAQVIVCYKPGSKSFRSDLNTKFDAAGVQSSTPCLTTPDASACFWCVQ